LTTPQADRTGEGGELPPCNSVWRLWYDLVWAHALVWFVSCGRPVSLTPGVHLYFADRYGWLGACHARAGRLNRASACWAKAEWHLECAGPDPNGPFPLAAAGAMPVPRPWQSVDARAHRKPSSGPGLRPFSSPSSA
jgi:hypothetical protein